MLNSALLAVLAPTLTAAQDNNVECPGVLNNSDDGNYWYVTSSLPGLASLPGLTAPSQLRRWITHPVRLRRLANLHRTYNH